MVSWDHFCEHYVHLPVLEFGFEYARMEVPAHFFAESEPLIRRALEGMRSLEEGAIANSDEERMVGHYWLRDSTRAPSPEIQRSIDDTLDRIKRFAADVHSQRLVSPEGRPFRSLLIVGIGGSVLGPQFVTNALRSHRDKLSTYFFDNTDPNGMDRVLSDIPDLKETIVLVVSKSGGTKETRNGMIVVQEAFRREGLSPAGHFVAITGENSALASVALDEKWLATFPMWDWVGGRTSELSAVGLLPAALQGYSINDLLLGARQMDEQTRSPEVRKNPALLMALLWLHATHGKGEKSLVVLPYRDRLELFSRYLQQLIMESLGKEFDLAGDVVHQGISVYGNKGSTDQHAYVQQLRDGVNNFFVTFLEVLSDSSGDGEDVLGGKEVEEGIVAGDYLSGFLQGTKEALHEKQRLSLTLTITQVNELSIGRLIALFERAVGFYASFVNVNAYHQPGVEAGKKAAAEILDLQKKIVAVLKKESKPLSAQQLTERLDNASTERIFRILSHLWANNRVSCVDRNVPVTEWAYVIRQGK
jgi:glucose-6-phosphate isomerase